VTPDFVPGGGVYFGTYDYVVGLCSATASDGIGLWDIRCDIVSAIAVDSSRILVCCTWCFNLFRSAFLTSASRVFACHQ
jgi:hypothetical protein